MTRAHKLNIAGKTAIIAALMGGSTLSLAQDAAPVVAVPEQPVPVAASVPDPVFTPPPLVSTLPNSNDVINPVAAQEAAAEAAPQRQALATPTAPIRGRANARPTTPPVAPATVSEPSGDITPPAVDPTEPSSAAIENATPIVTIDEAVAQDTGIANEDLTLFGGMAAALAAIGLGAAFASRRRRRRIGTDNHVAVVHSNNDFVAPRPIKDDPAFQQFTTATTAAPLVERPIQRAPIMTRPDVPIADPLFSTPVMAGPITDPMFAPRNDVEIPITDPLFAKHDRYVGRAPAISATNRALEPVN